MDIEQFRNEIPATAECCYLNTGASGPSPERVVAAETEFLRRHKLQAPCGDGMYDVAFDALGSARETVASFLGTAPENVALTESTVEGINHVSTGIEWDEGDVVVRTDAEHSAGRLPWERMRDIHGIEIKTLETETGRIDPDRYADAVEDARLVCLNSPTWNYGTRLSIGELVDVAHDAGAQVLVDAVQAPGQMAFDVEDWGADFVAASGHKWLLGPWGSGFLYVADDALETLAPRRIGYFSVENPKTAGYEYYPDARRFELGTRALAPYVGLEAAVNTIQSVGLKRIEGQITRLTDRLKDGLGDRLLSPADAETGLVTFAAEEPESLVERLGTEEIKIRVLPDPHACRVSVHAFNTATEIDQLLDALERHSQ